MTIYRLHMIINVFFLPRIAIAVLLLTIFCGLHKLFFYNTYLNALRRKKKRIQKSRDISLGYFHIRKTEKIYAEDGFENRTFGVSFYLRKTAIKNFDVPTCGSTTNIHLDFLQIYRLRIAEKYLCIIK